MSSAHEALVRQAIELIWNRGDLDAADEFFAPGYVNHHGLIVDLILGPEAVRRVVSRCLSPDCTSAWRRSARSTIQSCSDGPPELAPTDWVASPLRPRRNR